jgi:hypothetical protein
LRISSVYFSFTLASSAKARKDKKTELESDDREIFEVDGLSENDVCSGINANPHMCLISPSIGSARTMSAIILKF